MSQLTNREKKIIFDKFNLFQDAKNNYPGNIDILDKLDINLDIPEKFTKKTLLIISCEHNSLYFFNKLIDKKINLNNVDNCGMSGFMYACCYGNIEIVNKLIDKQVDVTLKDKFGKTALMLASLKGHLNIVKKLVLKDANIEEISENGYNVLLMAVESDNIKLVEYLIDTCCMDVNFRTYLSGITALMIASKKNLFNMTKFLLDKGADKNIIDNFMKFNAENFAMGNNNDMIIRLLSENKKRKL